MNTCSVLSKVQIPLETRTPESFHGDITRVICLPACDVVFYVEDPYLAGTYWSFFMGEMSNSHFLQCLEIQVILKR